MSDFPDVKDVRWHIHTTLHATCTTAPILSAYPRRLVQYQAKRSQARTSPGVEFDAAKLQLRRTTFSHGSYCRWHCRCKNIQTCASLKIQ